jgi:hypothetical protein
MLQRLAAIAALTATGSEAPAAQAAAAVEAAERVAADRRGCVAAIAAIPSGRAAALGPQQLGSGIVWDKLGHIIVPYAPLTRLQRQGTAGDPTVSWQPPLGLLQRSTGNPLPVQPGAQHVQAASAPAPKSSAVHGSPPPSVACLVHRATRQC